MGIHNLIKYISASNPINLAQCESGKNIYISNIVYFDITYKLIEIYNKYIGLLKNKDQNNVSNTQFKYPESLIHNPMLIESDNESESIQNFQSVNFDDIPLDCEFTLDFQSKVNNLLNYVEKELLNIFCRLKNFNRIIYVFVDYKFMNNLRERNVIFKDFLNMNIEEHERTNSIPMIKRKYLKLLDKCDEDEYDTMKYLVKKVRCMFELKSIYSVSNKLDIEKYISIPYLIKTEKDKKKISKLTVLLDEGKFRYFILRGGKYLIKKQRGKDLFSFFDPPQNTYSKTKSCGDENEICVKSLNNIDKLLFDSVTKNGYEKLNEFYNYIPFTIIIYLFPMLVKKINLDNVKFFGCEIESDFAISKHIHTYSKNAFPTIYSSDTDMLCLMCDVDCVVKLSIKNGRRNLKKNKDQRTLIEDNIIKFFDGKHVSDNLTFFVNPISFWEELFKCKLSPKIIKILCVLMGTDYNPYHPKSPIHIRYFDDILKILNIDKFEDIDEDVLLANIYMIMKNNEDNVYCKQTAIALNMYLNELEGEIHFITESTNISKIDSNRFLRYSKRTVFI